MYKDFIHFFVLSCQKATYLLEKRTHGKLNLIERIQLKLHLSICGHCARYEKEAKLIDKAIREVIKEQNEKELHLFTEAELKQAKERMVKQVKKRMTKS